MASPSGQVCEGTVKPFPAFDAEADSKTLRDAMKGLGTNEQKLINVLAYRSNAQRLELKLKYKTLFGRDLIDDLKSELSGDFENVMVGLMMGPADYDAYEIKHAIRGLGTDEAALIEIICTRTQDEIKAIKEAYKKHYKKSVESDVASDTSGHFKRILVSLLTGARDPEGPVDHEKAKKDARELYDSGEATWGTDESVFNMIMGSRSYAHLRVVFEEYRYICKYDIAQSISREMSGDVEEAMLTIVQCVRDKSGYFAQRLYKSMKGMGTDERTLTRVMVSRSEVDLVQIKEKFKEKYGKTLGSFIKGDTGGDFRKVLMALAREE